MTTGYDAARNEAVNEPVNEPVNDAGAEAGESNTTSPSPAGKNRSNALKDRARGAAEHVVGDTLSMAENATTAFRATTDTVAGAANAIGTRVKRTAQKQEEKLNKAKATAAANLERAVSVSERRASKEGMKAAKRHSRLLKQQRKSKIANLQKDLSAMNKQQKIIDQQNRKVQRDLMESQVNIMLKEGKTIAVQFKKYNWEHFRDVRMAFAVLKTMDELNKEMLQVFDRNFANRDFKLAIEDQDNLFRGLQPNDLVPSTESLKEIRDSRGNRAQTKDGIPVLIELGAITNADAAAAGIHAASAVAPNERAAAGGGKTKRKKRISKRKKRISKRKKRISKRKR